MNSAHYYVLDSNVLLHDMHAIQSFNRPQQHIIIPIYVIEELDSFKEELSERGQCARYVTRWLDQQRSLGSLATGILLEQGAYLRVIHTHNQLPYHMTALQSVHTAHISHLYYDELILRCALDLLDQGKHVTLVSKDINLRVRADVHGVCAIDYRPDYQLEYQAQEDSPFHNTEMIRHSILTPEHEYLWSQWQENPSQSITLSLDALLLLQGKSFDTIYTHQSIYVYAPAVYQSSSHAQSVHDGDPSSMIATDEYKIFTVLASGDTAICIPQQSAWGLSAINAEQALALHHLLDPSIELICITGKAGTGKTLIALAAGLSQVIEAQRYEQILVSRAIFPLGKDLGYLPGTLEEKMEPWLQPIYDNLSFLLRQKKSRQPHRGHAQADDFLEMGYIDIQPITYIRGRSIPHQFLLIDEAQNLTTHEIKTILTRAGEGSKVVLIGDPAQVDHPYLDAQQNGLSHVIRQFKGQSCAAHIDLIKGERSDLAALAADLL